MPQTGQTLNQSIIVLATTHYGKILSLLSFNFRSAANGTQTISHEEKQKIICDRAFLSKGYLLGYLFKCFYLQYFVSLLKLLNPFLSQDQNITKNMPPFNRTRNSLKFVLKSFLVFLPSFVLSNATKISRTE